MAIQAVAMYFVGFIRMVLPCLMVNPQLSWSKCSYQSMVLSQKLELLVGEEGEVEFAVLGEFGLVVLVVGLAKGSI